VALVLLKVLAALETAVQEEALVVMAEEVLELEPLVRVLLAVIMYQGLAVAVEDLQQ
jgi:hypothetical protein